MLSNYIGSHKATWLNAVEMQVTTCCDRSQFVKEYFLNVCTRIYDMCLHVHLNMWEHLDLIYVCANGTCYVIPS